MSVHGNEGNGVSLIKPNNFQEIFLTFIKQSIFALMKLVYNGNKLSKEVRTKRLIELDIDIRTCASNMGISAATLSRIENGKTPDVETLATVCYWISQPIDEFFSTQKKQKSK